MKSVLVPLSSAGGTFVISLSCFLATLDFCMMRVSGKRQELIMIIIYILASLSMMTL